MTGPRLRSLPALVCAALLVLTGCTASRDGTPSESAATGSSSGQAPGSGSESSSTSEDPTTSPSSSTPATVPPAPRNGACYRLSVDQLTQPSNDSTPVSCSARHVAQTIAVGRLASVVDGHALAVDSDRVLGQLKSACPRALARHVGGSAADRDLSRFKVVWFTPTLEQSDRGADWFRCDLVAIAAEKQLQPLPSPARLRGVLDRPAGASYGLCGTAAPGARGFERVICARPHSWRAVSTIGIQGGNRYPGARAARAAGDEICRNRVRAEARDRLKFQYGWEWPSREQWEAGQRFGYCWAPD